MNKWGIIFHFSFASLPATVNKKIGGELLTWATREKAEKWAMINCGPNLYEAIEIKEEVKQ